MTRVEFHVLAAGEDHCFESHVCDFVRRRAMDQRLSLHVDDAAQADRWRKALADCPVEVFHPGDDVPKLPFQGELLLNIASEVPPLFSAFPRAVDLVADSDEARIAGRERYRFYRDRGYPLRHINVTHNEIQT